MHPKDYWFPYPLIVIDTLSLARDKFRIKGLTKDIKRK